jgi:hypothetical protein
MQIFPVVDKLSLFDFEITSLEFKYANSYDLVL